MGLDITAYRQLARAKEGEGVIGEDVETGYARMYVNPEFPGRADEIVDRAVYQYGEDLDFRAGSYGGYNRWREWLAALVGYTPRQAWDGECAGKPFVELVNFSDCEGVIGTALSKKLAADFAEHQPKADASGDAWHRELYAKWREAFEMATDGGAVQFH